MNIMKLKRQLSPAPDYVLNTAEVLVDFARSPQHLVDLAHTVWPRLSIYKGHTHWRFLTEGKTDGESFYLDLEEAR
jgi:hypothetical protein